MEHKLNSSGGSLTANFMFYVHVVVYWVKRSSFDFIPVPECWTFGSNLYWFFPQQTEPGKQLRFRESRLENSKKKASDIMVSKDKSAEIMVHAPKNVKRVCQRRCPKSLSSVLKRRQQRRSSFISAANSNKVPVAQDPFFVFLFVSCLILYHILLFWKIAYLLVKLIK